MAQAPVLAELTRLAAESQARLAIIRPLLPPALRPLVKAGAPDTHAWDLLVPHSAAASKLRQLSPHLLAALSAAGHPVQSLHIKVMSHVPGSRSSPA